MKPTPYSITFTIGFALSAGCNRPACHNSNPVFDQSTPGSRTYQTALARQLRNTHGTSLRYWFDKCLEKDGHDFIEVYIQGDAVCAKGLLLVNDWGKLAAIKETGGAGYHGAELDGLQISIEGDSTDTRLVYKSVEKIID